MQLSTKRNVVMTLMYPMFPLTTPALTPPLETPWSGRINCLRIDQSCQLGMLGLIHFPKSDLKIILALNRKCKQAKIPFYNRQRNSSASAKDEQN